MASVEEFLFDTEICKGSHEIFDIDENCDDWIEMLGRYHEQEGESEDYKDCIPHCRNSLDKRRQECNPSKSRIRKIIKKICCHISVGCVLYYI